MSYRQWRDALAKYTDDALLEMWKTVLRNIHNLDGQYIKAVKSEMRARDFPLTIS